MDKREIIATILHYANELDESGYMLESDKLTKIAEDYSFEEEFDPHIGEKENAIRWMDELGPEEQQRYLDSLNFDEGGDVGDLSDEETGFVPEDISDEDITSFDDNKFNLSEFKKRLEGAGADIAEDFDKTPFEEESHPTVDLQEDALRRFDRL